MLPKFNCNLADSCSFCCGLYKQYKKPRSKIAQHIPYVIISDIIDVYNLHVDYHDKILTIYENLVPVREKQERFPKIYLHKKLFPTQSVVEFANLIIEKIHSIKIFIKNI